MIPLILFLIVLVALSVLFVLKYIELQKGSVLFASKFRNMCDMRIMHVESYCKGKCTIKSILHSIKHIYNTLAHKFAKVTASIAKKIEWRARSVAHKSAKAKKDGAEVRENKYLKDVKNHKDSLDIARVAEETKL